MAAVVNSDDPGRGFSWRRSDPQKTGGRLYLDAAWNGHRGIPLKASPSTPYPHLSYGDGGFAYLHSTEVRLLNAAPRETPSLRVKDKAKIVNGANVLAPSPQGGSRFCTLGKEERMVPAAHSEEGRSLGRALAAVRKSLTHGGGSQTF